MDYAIDPRQPIELVIFDTFNAKTQTFEDIEVPVAEARAFHDANKASTVKKVIWCGNRTYRDGSRAWSWAKAFFIYGSDRTLCRIGAGANDDLTVWESADCPGPLLEHRAKAEA